MNSDEIRDSNRDAWNAGRYEGWVRGDGPPAQNFAPRDMKPDTPVSVWMKFATVQS